MLVSFPRPLSPASTPEIDWSFMPLPQTVSVFQLTWTQRSKLRATSTSSIGVGARVPNNQINNVITSLACLIFPDIVVYCWFPKNLFNVSDFHAAYDSCQTTSLYTATQLCACDLDPVASQIVTRGLRCNSASPVMWGHPTWCLSSHMPTKRPRAL